MIALVAGLGGSVAVANEEIDDLRRQREAARDAAATALAELELLTIEDQEVAAALVELEANIEAQIASIAGARQALAEAEAEVVVREAAVASLLSEIELLEEEVTRRAVESYVGVTDPGLDWLASDDLNQTAVRLTLLDFSAGNDRDVFDALRATRAELEENLVAGQQARDDARNRRLELEEDLVELEERIELQRILHEEIRQRMIEWELAAEQRAREAEEFTQLIRRTQVETLGFEPGAPGAASVQGFVMPVAGSIGSGFGPRHHPIFDTTRMHNGVDIAGPEGRPVWAAKDGVIIYAGWRGGYGNTVVIQHEGDVATLYAHLSQIDARVGDFVAVREVIGLMGSTGWSTGPHLHLEVRRDGVPEDPELYLPI